MNEPVKKNPRGAPPSGLPVLRAKHLRFIGAAYANGYQVADCLKMFVEEFGMQPDRGTIRKYYQIIGRNAYAVGDAIARNHRNISEEFITEVVRGLEPKARTNLGPLFHEWVLEKKRIAEDPTYNVLYGEKRRRIMKLSQNVDELDEPKTFSKGSYPTSREKDGSMTFETYEVKNKDHAEQRKTIEAIGNLVDGNVGGDVVINIHHNAPSEEEETSFQIEAKKKMALLKAKKEAGKDPGFDPKEEDAPEKDS